MKHFSKVRPILRDTYADTLYKIDMALRYLIALPLPIFIQTFLILLWQRSDTGSFETAHGVAICILMITFVIGIIALIPTFVAQILVARTLVKSEAPLLNIFLIGMMNPSGAIATILVMGWMYNSNQG